VDCLPLVLAHSGLRDFAARGLKAAESLGRSFIIPMRLQPRKTNNPDISVTARLTPRTQHAPRSKIMGRLTDLILRPLTTGMNAGTVHLSFGENPIAAHPKFGYPA